MGAKLDCPFCGNENIDDWGEGTWSRPVKWMYCTECHAQGPRVMLKRDEEHDAWLQRAIAAWNDRRPAPPRRAGRVGSVMELKHIALLAALVLPMLTCSAIIEIHRIDRIVSEAPNN